MTSPLHPSTRAALPVRALCASAVSRSSKGRINTMDAQPKANILIVDDNHALCKTVSLVLQRKGYEMTTAEDGLEAIEKVKENAFDVIFMDVKMPRLDGVATYKTIREIRPESAVIMMTGYAVEELVQQALEDGAYAIIHKPLDIDRAVALIEQARRERRSALIMVVDDDPRIRDTLSKILIRKGYDVTVAADGEEAVALSEQRSHDILFIDMKLPAMNGLQLFLALKQVRPQAVAIMMTGYRWEMHELVREALDNHAYTCLYKPLDMETLLRLVREISERKQEAR